MPHPDRSTWLMALADVADRLTIPIAEARRLVKGGEVRAHRSQHWADEADGSTLRVAPRDLDKFVTSHLALRPPDPDAYVSPVAAAFRLPRDRADREARAASLGMDVVTLARASLRLLAWTVAPTVEGCWAFRPHATHDHISINGHTTSARRLAYVLGVGPLPAFARVVRAPGCRTPRCVQPLHLDVES